MSPVGDIFVPFPPKTGTNLLHPRPSLPIVERVVCDMVESDGYYLRWEVGGYTASLVSSCEEIVWLLPIVQSYILLSTVVHPDYFIKAKNNGNV